MHYHWNIYYTSPWFCGLTAVLSVGFFLLLFGRLIGPPGQSQITSFFAFVAFLLLLFGGLVLASGLRLAWIGYKMSQDGRVAEAVVRERSAWTDPGEWEVRSPRDYVVVVFEFRDEAGRRWQVEREVEGGEAWAWAHPNDPAPPIEYLCGDPATWRFAAESLLWLRLVLTGGAAVMAAVGLRPLCAVMFRVERGAAPDRRGSSALPES